MDECLTEAKCDALTEECLNLPGGYTCLCKWGLVDLANGEGCVPNAALALAENQKEISSKENTAIFPKDRPGEESFDLMLKGPSLVQPRLLTISLRRPRRYIFWAALSAKKPYELK